MPEISIGSYRWCELSAMQTPLYPAEKHWNSKIKILDQHIPDSLDISLPWVAQTICQPLRGILVPVCVHTPPSANCETHLGTPCARVDGGSSAGEGKRFKLRLKSQVKHQLKKWTCPIVLRQWMHCWRSAWLRDPTTENLQPGKEPALDAWLLNNNVSGIISFTCNVGKSHNDDAFECGDGLQKSLFAILDTFLRCVRWCEPLQVPAIDDGLYPYKSKADLTGSLSLLWTQSTGRTCGCYYTYRDLSSVWFEGQMGTCNSRRWRISGRRQNGLWLAALIGSDGCLLPMGESESWPCCQNQENLALEEENRWEDVVPLRRRYLPLL